MKILLPFLKIVGILCVFTGILFKILHWKFSTELLLSSIPVLIAYCTLAVFNKYLATTSGQLQVLGVSMITVHLILFFADLPYSHPVILWGGLAFALGTPLFFRKENKTEEELFEERYGGWLEDEPEDER